MLADRMPAKVTALRPRRYRAASLKLPAPCLRQRKVEPAKRLHAELRRVLAGEEFGDGALHAIEGKADIGLRKRRGIVNAVADHADFLAGGLQLFHLVGFLSWQYIRQHRADTQNGVTAQIAELHLDIGFKGLHWVNFQTHSDFDRLSDICVTWNRRARSRADLYVKL